MNQQKYVSETKEHLTASDEKTAHTIFAQMIKYFVERGERPVDKKTKS